MKVKELIKILQAVNPDTTVSFQVGGCNDDEYRTMCAKAELASGHCISDLKVLYVEIREEEHEDEITTWPNICLQPLCGFLEDVKEFDAIYKKRD